jgi:hypothetical protein
MANMPDLRHPEHIISRDMANLDISRDMANPTSSGRKRKLKQHLPGHHPGTYPNLT